MYKAAFIDDEEVFLDMYGDKFRSVGFEILTCSDSANAFNEVIAFRPDIIFLDLVMKGLDGLSFLKLLKASVEIKWVPIVMLSNINNPSDKEECLKEGASQFLIKADFTPGDLLQYAREILKML